MSERPETLADEMNKEALERLKQITQEHESFQEDDFKELTQYYRKIMEVSERIRTRELI